MVEKLCSRYGSPIILADSGAEEASTPFPEKNTSHIQDQSFYSFPTLDQLAEATEADLRAAGFGCEGLKQNSRVATQIIIPNGYFSNSTQVSGQIYRWLCVIAGQQGRGRACLAYGSKECQYVPCSAGALYPTRCE